MHRCLLVPEIIRLITEEMSSFESEVFSDGSYFLGEWPISLPQDERASFAALARVCKVFYEPAMDALWKNLDSLDRVLRQVSGVIHAAPADSTGTLTGPSARFFENAKRVQSVYVYQRPGAVDQLRELKLRHPCMPVLFPNLRKLTVYRLSPELASFLPWFIGPTLERLGTLSCLDANFYTTTLAQIAQVAPRFQELCHFAGVPEKACSIHSAFRHLTVFRCTSGITRDGLLRLSRLPALRTLKLSTMPHIAPDSLGANSFPSLVEVAIAPGHAATDISSVSLLMRSISSPALKSACVDTAHSSWEPSARSVNDLLHAVSKHTSLTELSIVAPEYRAFHGEPLPISTLFGHSALEYLRLALPGILVTPDDISRMGTAWPRLHTFEMRRQRGGMPLGTTTFKFGVLALFALHMPRLSHLAIDVETVSQAELDLPGVCCTNPILLSLDHNNLEESDGFKIAAYIDAVYPKASIDTDVVSLELEVAKLMPEAAFSASKAWLRISDEYLPLLARVREHERMRAEAARVA
ncbi:hypothetical protein PsYK624_105350 [Phanerochaete sordida]|uniref:F-box domain-containing protein n=1 Tax=Phanerochaete sordida TaxID=48140 RepID=A0A9P3GGH7_9APHY|nr:hypothetical protein PsYK624_105350 [Phanerochaete sordida]